MITWGNWYWPWWLGASVASFLAMEVYALVSKGTDNTLSNWVWTQLHATVRESMSQWTAAHFLVFGVWLVLVIWLTWHFFFHFFAL